MNTLVLSPRDRRLTYVVIGLLVSLGVPCGLFLMNLALAGVWTRAAALQELSGNRAAYLYAGLSTAVAFSAFGAFVGHRAEHFARLSTIDPLTGMPNARAACERLTEEIAHARRYNVPLSFVLADLDELKRINDTWGHAAGDRAIRHLAKAISAELRAADFAARRSGDEFLIIASATDPGAAGALAERIAGRLGAIDDHVGFRVTASIGVAGWNPGDGPLSAESLERLADRALYQSKNRGRNGNVSVTRIAS